MLDGVEKESGQKAIELAKKNGSLPLFAWGMVYSSIGLGDDESLSIVKDNMGDILWC